MATLQTVGIKGGEVGMIYLGVDPGKRGGFAYIHEIDRFVEYRAYSWDDVIYIAVLEKLMKLNEPIFGIVEKVSAMPNQGVVSMFTFGKSCGYIEGVLSAFKIAFQTVVPMKWKREFSLNKSKDDSIVVCQKLFPNADLMRNERCVKPSDGMAEALLMAEYGRRLYKRGGES